MPCRPPTISCCLPSAFWTGTCRVLTAFTPLRVGAEEELAGVVAARIAAAGPEVPDRAGWGGTTGPLLRRALARPSEVAVKTGYERSRMNAPAIAPAGSR